MDTRKTIRNNLIMIFLILTAMLMIATASSFALDAPNASGKVDSSGGVNLRKSASTNSAVVTGLANNTDLLIYREVFTSKKSASKKNVWYYVKANGKKGYIRSDLVDNVQYGSVTGTAKSKLVYRKGAGTKMKKAGTYKKGKTFTVCLAARPVSSTKGPSKTWYKVKSGSKYYYVCSKYVKLSSAAKAVTSSPTTNSNPAYISSPTTNMSDNQFEAYMTAQGFPDTYKAKLRTLHKAHPNWGFVGYKTGISWSAALKAQTKKGVSLVSKSLPASYRDGSKQAEAGWYYANSTVVAYYMDPRNFLNENSIYMFEDLSYKPRYQTASAVSAILKPTKLPGYGFTANIFVNAGAANNVSPVFLASRARQENGGGGDAVNGKKILGKTVYNPFNIGAFGGTDPLYKGLIYAYGKGWDTPAKSVQGGSFELAKNYIHQGQYTEYYQRFNVRNGANKVGTHQYMTNIVAPYTEALSTKNSYSQYGITNQSLVFEIPIYESMPKSTKLP